MNDKHDILTYCNLGEGANFYLSESFHYINVSLVNEYAGIIFSEKLEQIDPTSEDHKTLKSAILPENPIDLLQQDLPEVLTNETTLKMSHVWEESQTLAQMGGYKFGKDHSINSIEILGHLNNFGFFIETIVNRHLLFLKHSKKIDDFSYSRISIAKIMERFIFIFKNELMNKEIALNEIVNLFKLRNKTVHYTPDNAIVLKPKISELLQIWTQTCKVLEKLEKMELFNEDHYSTILKEYIETFRTNWL